MHTAVDQTSERLPALRARAVELQQMSRHLEPSLPRQSLLEVSQIAIREVDRRTTHAAYQMMVVSLRAGHHVATTTVAGMNTTHETVPPKNIKGAVHRDATDVGRELPRTLQYGFGGEALMARSQYLQDSMALWGEPIPMIPEDSRDSVGR